MHINQLSLIEILCCDHVDLVTNMNLRMNAQDEKIERLFVLHGAMLERMDEIKTVQDKEVDKLNGRLCSLVMTHSCRSVLICDM